VENFKSEDWGSAGAPQQWISLGEGSRYVTCRCGRSVSHGEEPR
jgi:hypothetical protein